MSARLFLLFIALVASPTLSQGSQCQVKIQECSEAISSALSSGVNDAAQICPAVKAYVDCVHTSGCPELVASVVNQMLAPLKTQGIDCGIDSDTGSEGGFDMGAGAGGPFESCTTGMQACTESLKNTISDGSIAKEPCKTMQTYVNCIFSLDCPIEESQKQEIVDKSIGQLNDQGFNCDIKYAGSGSSAGAETEYGSGPKTEPEGGAKVDEGIGTFTGPAGDFVMLMQVQALFVKHGCDKTFENCASEVKGSENEQMPSCSDIKKSGQCMFKECSDIKGSGDDTEVAKLLAKFASQSSKCEITAEDLIGSGALGVLQRPVWSSVLFVLVAVVTKTVLI